MRLASRLEGGLRRVPLRRTAGWLLVTTLLAGAGASHAACGDSLPPATRLQAEGAGWQLAFAPRPVPVVVGQAFALDIELCAPQGQPQPAALKVDAEMPAHRHGMNYRATVQALGGGRYRAEGLMFHMPGRWRLHFDLDRAGSPSAPLRLSRDLELP